MSDDPPQSPTTSAPEVSPEQATPAAPVEDHESTIRDLRSSLSSAQSQLAQQSTKLASLADLQVELAQLKDQHSFIKAAKEAVESQLQAERVKRETAEEAAEDLKGQIESLRGQVEQARRGVGILQKQEKERKRMSVIGGGGLGLSGGGVDALLEEPAELQPPPPATSITDKASKRASMILGSVKHKRSSSASEGSDHLTGGGAPLSTSPGVAPVPAPGARPGLRGLRLGAASTAGTPPSLHSPSVADPDESRMPSYRSVSGASATTAYTTGGLSPSKRDATLRDAVAREREAREYAEKEAREAEDEQVRLTKELISVKSRLVEAEEARIASDECLKALREFIAASTGAPEGQDPLADPAAAGQLLKGISLPPLPTDRDADLRDDDKPLPARPSPRKTPSATGWGSGFTSLFRGANPAAFPASPAMSTTAEAPITPQPILSPPSHPRTISSASRAPSLTVPSELDERAVEGIPTATPVTWVSSWTKNVPSTSSAGHTPVAPGPNHVGDGERSPPLPPTNTRKLSSFFGFNRETKLPVSHEFDAHDAFTPEPPSGEALEPSPMPQDEEEDEAAGESEKEKPTPNTTTTAQTDEVRTPMLLSPRSQAQSVVGDEAGGMQKRMEGGENAQEAGVPA